MQKQFTVVLVAFVAATTLGACAAAPLHSPMRMGPVDAGAGSLESVRRQLSGSWDLVSLTAFQPPSGNAVDVKASAVLTYDDYGNLTMKGARTDAGRDPATTALLDYSGRAVIDVANQQLHLQSISGSGASDPTGAEVFLASVRRYAFEGELLKISTIDAKGNTTATAVWKRRTP
jgi:hypothetical protein